MADSPIAVEHHNPALKHHFSTMEQQREASSLGMWLFLATEIMFFGGMFCAYLIYRYWYFSDFAAASNSLDITLGTVNTAVLICSSLTVVMAVRAAQIGQTSAAGRLSGAYPGSGTGLPGDQRRSSGPASSKSTTSPDRLSISRAAFPAILTSRWTSITPSFSSRCTLP